jgi:hypothetical protein
MNLGILGLSLLCYASVYGNVNGLAPILTKISNDSGTDPNDRVTNDQTLILFGVSEANSTVSISRNVLGIIGVVQADNEGNWRFDYTATVLQEGIYSFTFTSLNQSGNSTESLAYTIVIDTSAEIPVIKRIGDDTGISNSDEITNDCGLIFYGISEPYATVNLRLAGHGSLGNTIADASGNWIFNFAFSILPQGKHFLTAKITDLAGNISALSDDFTLLIDMDPPSVPSIQHVSQDRGISNSDRITNDQTLHIKGLSEPKSIVVLTRVGFGILGTADADINGIWEFNYSGTTLSEGNYTFTAMAYDVAGNISPASTNFVVTIEITPPSAPTDIVMSDDLGISNTDNITNDKTFTIKGVGEANTRIFLIRNNTDTLGYADVDIVGTWIFENTPTLGINGNYSLTIIAMDVAGNLSVEQSISFSIDAEAPMTIISSLEVNPAPLTPINIQIEFSEEVFNFSSADVVVEGGSLSEWNGSGSLYTCTITPLSEAAFYVGIDKAVVTDRAGNGNLSSDFQMVYGACSSPDILESPSNKIVCEGESLTMSVKATGTNLSYQWQVNVGGGFINLYDESIYNGVHSNLLSLSDVTIEMNNYEFRCVVYGTCAPSFTSSVAVLNVNAKPTVSFSLPENNFCTTSPEIFLPMSMPIGGIYSGNGITSDKFDPAVAGVGDHTLTYTYMDENGCSNSQENIMTVSVCTGTYSDHLDKNRIYVYPNPAADLLSINYEGFNSLSFTIVNSHGEILIKNNLYTQINQISLKDFPSGIYLLMVWKGSELVKQEKIVKE